MKNYVFCILIFSAIFIHAFSYAEPTINSAIHEVNEPVPGAIEEAVKEYFPPMLPPLKTEEQPIFSHEGSFLIKDIQLNGVESFNSEDLDYLIEDYENKQVTIKELQNLSRNIEAAILDKGLIAACVIPPQDISKGIIEIKVLEAKMGELIISDHKYFTKKRLGFYWIPEKHKSLRYDEISRSLYLMNKNPDRSVRATLKAGKKFQTTDVFLDATTHFPLHLAASIDNEGAAQTGVIRQNYGIKHNNALGLDDTLFGGYSFGNEFDSVYAYHSIPVNDSGASIFYGYNYNKATPREEFRALGVDSRSKNVTVQLHQDIFKKADYAGKVFLAFDSKDKQTKTNTGTLNRDRLRILRLGGSYIERNHGKLTQITPEISQGLNFFGARRLNEFSSRGAKNVFTKFNLSIEHQRALVRELSMTLRLKGQVASNKLTPQEGFFIGGIDSVRGYPSGDFTADNAIQANFELLAPVFFLPADLPLPFTGKRLRESINLIAFYDVGLGWKKNADPAEDAQAHLHSIGAGIRLHPVDNAVVRFEWGFPMGNVTRTEEGNSRFHFGIDFDMPF